MSLPITLFSISEENIFGFNSCELAVLVKYVYKFPLLPLVIMYPIFFKAVCLE